MRHFWEPNVLQNLKNLRAKVLKIEQRISYAQHQKVQIMRAHKTRNIDLRRARTHMLIRLGALIEKSGLRDLVGIELGQDLQQDAEYFESTAMLLGALLELKDYWTHDDIEQQKQLWVERGKRVLKTIGTT